jgi:hypothetical protein
MTALNMLCESVMPKVGFILKSLIIKMERAKGFEPSRYFPRIQIPVTNAAGSALHYVW